MKMDLGSSAIAQAALRRFVVRGVLIVLAAVVLGWLGLRQICAGRRGAGLAVLQLMERSMKNDNHLDIRAQIDAAERSAKWAQAFDLDVQRHLKEAGGES